MTTVCTIEVMWRLQDHRDRGMVRGLAEFEDERLPAYRITAPREDLHGGEAASNR